MQFPGPLLIHGHGAAHLGFFTPVSDKVKETFIFNTVFSNLEHFVEGGEAVAVGLGQHTFYHLLHSKQKVSQS